MRPERQPEFGPIPWGTEPGQATYRMRLTVSFTAEEPPPIKYYNLHTEEKSPMCPGCDSSVTFDERRVYTGGDKTGARTQVWHEKCLVGAVTDPTQMWIQVGQQIARAPHKHTAAEIRMALQMLARIAAGRAAVDGTVEVSHGRPYALVSRGMYASPELQDDGAVVFRTDPNDLPF